VGGGIPCGSSHIGMDQQRAGEEQGNSGTQNQEPTIPKTRQHQTNKTKQNKHRAPGDEVQAVQSTSAQPPNTRAHDLHSMTKAGDRSPGSGLPELLPHPGHGP
jgi:hypothetical protein